MKAKRLLFLVMAICLANGVKAQFYDGPDDIFFYLEESENGVRVSEDRKYARVFNFDGLKACELAWESVREVQKHLMEKPDYYEEKVETTVYEYEFYNSNGGTCYKANTRYCATDAWGNLIRRTLLFSSDRNTLFLTFTYDRDGHKRKHVLKRVDKSYFRVGRSRKPSGTMYE